MPKMPLYCCYLFCQKIIFTYVIQKDLLQQRQEEFFQLQAFEAKIVCYQTAISMYIKLGRIKLQLFKLLKVELHLKRPSRLNRVTSNSRKFSSHGKYTKKGPNIPKRFSLPGFWFQISWLLLDFVSLTLDNLKLFKYTSITHKFRISNLIRMNNLIQATRRKICMHTCIYETHLFSQISIRKNQFHLNIKINN